MSNKLILAAGLIAIGAIILMVIIGWWNKAIVMEENINTSLANISKEEQRKVDLFNNLVDAIKSYNKFEKETFQLITEARTRGNNGQVDEAMLTLNAVAEAYPELKSQANYATTLLEFSITENRIAGYREQYNKDVKSYNAFVRSVPTGIVLRIMGYIKQDYKYLDFNINPEDARNLFE